jgi:hypothetical protein
MTQACMKMKAVAESAANMGPSDPGDTALSAQEKRRSSAEEGRATRFKSPGAGRGSF